MPQALAERRNCPSPHVRCMALQVDPDKLGERDLVPASRTALDLGLDVLPIPRPRARLRREGLFRPALAVHVVAKPPLPPLHQIDLPPLLRGHRYPVLS